MKELVDEPLCTEVVLTHLNDGEREINLVILEQEEDPEGELIPEPVPEPELEEEPELEAEPQFLGGPIKPRHAMKSARERKRTDMFDDQFGFFFYKIAGDDERLDSFELQRVMAMIFRNEFPNNSDFSLEACRAMISSMDSFREGKLTYLQFKVLWKKIMKWKYTFDYSERNKDGKIDYSELCIALRKLGYKLQNETIQLLMNRFQNKHGVIELDDFIQICSKLNSAKKSYEKTIKGGNAELDIFMLEIIYN